MSVFHDGNARRDVLVHLCHLLLRLSIAIMEHMQVYLVSVMSILHDGSAFRHVLLNPDHLLLRLSAIVMELSSWNVHNFSLLLQWESSLMAVHVLTSSSTLTAVMSRNTEARDGSLRHQVVHFTETAYHMFSRDHKATGNNPHAHTHVSPYTHVYPRRPQVLHKTTHHTHGDES